MEGSPEGQRRVPGRRRATEVGARVFLRAPRADDEHEFLALRRRSATFLRPWEPRPPAGSAPFAPAAYRAYLARARRRNADFSLVCALEDGAILGAFHLSQIVPQPSRCGFLGYWCGAPFAGQGYMREGLALALRRLFGTLALHRVEANIMPENAPSLALVRGAGFRCEGFSPRYLHIAGRWRDHERWALLEEDWRAARALKRGSNRRRKA